MHKIQKTFFAFLLTYFRKNVIMKIIYSKKQKKNQKGMMKQWHVMIIQRQHAL